MGAAWPAGHVEAIGLWGMGKALVTGAQQTRRCTYLSMKSSISNMAACNSTCSWKKRTMMLLSASGNNDEVVTPTPDKRPLLALDLARTSCCAEIKTGGNACDSRGGSADVSHRPCSRSQPLSVRC